MPKQGITVGGWRHISEAVGPTVRKAEALTEERAKIRMTVAKALLNNQVHLAFQPIVALTPEPRRAFCEALVRLDLPGMDPLPAATFIPLVEDTALGEALDAAVLRLALEALEKDQTLRLSINVGGRSLASLGWMETLADVAAKDRSITERLIVELTERSALNDIALAEAFISEVREHGASVAIDDFGSGATSFLHLRRLCFDILKIDGSFMRGIAHSPDNQTLVKSLVEISNRFEMLTVAEFAETLEDIKVAQSLGVDLFQGRYFGMPTLYQKDDQHEFQREQIGGM